MATTWTTKERVQRNGYKYVDIYFTMDTGRIYRYGPRLMPPGYDVEADAPNWLAHAEAKVQEQDEQDILNGIDDEERTDVLTATPLYPISETAFDRRRRFRRRLFRRIWRSNDVKKVRRILYPLWDWMLNTQGYSAQQIRTYLDINAAQYDRIEARMSAIAANIAFLDGDEAGEIDS
jgi:hypothetical protein